MNNFYFRILSNFLGSLQNHVRGFYYCILVLQQIQRILIRRLGSHLHGGLVLVLVQHHGTLGGVSQRTGTGNAAAATLEALGLGSLLGLWLQSLLIHVTMWAINIVIFVIVYGRMIEIDLLTSLAPIPVATLSNRELGNTGQNYLKSLFAVGFQGLLILVCVAIYAVLIQGIATGGDPIGAIWGCMGYSVLLCFCLFKTGSIARSVFSAH